MNLIKYTYALLIVILGLYRCEAQTIPDTTLANQYFDKGGKLFNAAKYDSAIVYLQKAAEIYQNHKLWNQYVRCTHLLGTISNRQRRFDQASDWLHRALAVAKREESLKIDLKIITLKLLGEVHKEKDEYNQAIDFLQQALQLQIQAHGENNFRTANIYLYLGIIHEKKGNFNQALAAYKKTLTIRRQVFGEKHRAVADCYNNIGLIYWKTGEYNTALEYQQKALKIRQQIHKKSTHQDLAMSYNNIAALYWSKGDYDRSLQYMKKVLEIDLAVQGEKHPNTAKTYSNLGAIYFSKGDYQRALEYQQKALKIGLLNPEGYAFEIATYYKSIGETLFKKGDYQHALQYLQKGLTLHLKVFGNRHPEVGSVYAMMGSIAHTVGDTTSALDYLHHALDIYLQAYGRKHAQVAAVYNSMAAVYRDAGATKQALDYCQKAIEISILLAGEQHPGVARYYQTMGEIYLQAKQAEKALEWTHKARNIQLAVLGSVHPELARSYLLLAQAEWRLDRIDQALVHLQNAVRANVASEEDEVYFQFDKVFSHEVLLETLQFKAHMLENRYLRSGEEEDIKVAFTTLKRAIALLDQMRFGYRAEGSKLFLAQKAKSVYEDAIRVALALHAATGKRDYKQTAFVFSEKAKASVLWEALIDAQARHFAGLPDSLLWQELDLRVDLAYYSTQIQKEELKNAGRDSLMLMDFRDRHFELTRRYEALLDRLERDFPVYYNLKYRDDVVTVSKVQEWLDEKTTLLSYFVGEKALYLFTFSKKEFNLTVQPPVVDLKQRINALHGSMIHKRGENNYFQFIAMAYSLYVDLIQPVKTKLKTSRLIIIPDEDLNILPFEVLLTSKQDQSEVIDYATLPYLLQNYHIGYAYSSILLLATARKPHRAPAYDYLAFAPVFAGGLPAESRAMDLIQANRDGLGRVALPASKEEVLSIQALFTKTYGLMTRVKGLVRPRTRVYLEEKASETNFKGEQLHAYRYLHLATHGFANLNAPDLSGLLFASDTTEQEDGVLYLPEIFNLNLNADLVVLSACESGTGKLARGEGLLGLTRGFLYAGARNLLVSLWQVGDWSTADLMRLFYQGLLNGLNKSEALRQAKLKLMRSHPDYARPYHWAPFILIGI